MNANTLNAKRRSMIGMAKKVRFYEASTKHDPQSHGNPKIYRLSGDGQKEFAARELGLLDDLVIISSIPLGTMILYLGSNTNLYTSHACLKIWQPVLTAKRIMKILKTIHNLIIMPERGLSPGTHNSIVKGAGQRSQLLRRKLGSPAILTASSCHIQKLNP